MSKTSKPAAKTTARRTKKNSKLAKAQAGVSRVLTSKTTQQAVGFGALALGVGFLASLGSQMAEKAVNAL
jgi:hypothetical protein